MNSEGGTEYALDILCRKYPGFIDNQVFPHMGTPGFICRQHIRYHPRILCRLFQSKAGCPAHIQKVLLKNFWKGRWEYIPIKILSDHVCISPIDQLLCVECGMKNIRAESFIKLSLALDVSTHYILLGKRTWIGTISSKCFNH